MYRIVEVTDPELLQRTVELLRAFPNHQRRRYAEHIRTVDHYFDDVAYDQELAELARRYGPPHGCVIAAVEDGQVIGAVCLRRLNDDACEMKRLYVPPEHRRKGVAKSLVQALTEFASQLGYRVMRLDTGSFMTEALALYTSCGFTRIPPYYPMDETLASEFVFMENKLVE